MKIFKPQDMDKLTYLSGTAVNREGTLIAYVSWKGDVASGEFRGTLHIVDTETGTDTVLIDVDDGVQRTQPAFYGDKLFYLSDATGRFQLCSYEIGTQSETQLTTARHGIVRYGLAGDGSRAVFETDVYPEDIAANRVFIEMNAEESAAWGKYLDNKPFVAENLTYKLDDWHGMRHGEIRRIGVVDTDGTSQKLFAFDWAGMPLECVWPVLSRDGSLAAFYGYPHSGAKGRTPEAFVCRADEAAGDAQTESVSESEPVMMNEESAGLKQISDGLYLYADNPPAFVNDEEVIVMAFPEFEDGSTMEMPFIINTATGEQRMLFDEHDDGICHGVHAMPANRTDYGSNPPYYCLDDAHENMYFISSFRGRENIYRKSLKDNSPIELVAAGETDIHSFAMSDRNFACIMGNVGMPAELHVCGIDDICNRMDSGTNEQGGTEPDDEPGNSAWKRLTYSNNWLDEFEVPETEEFWVDTDDGGRIQAWLMHPVCQEDDRMYPAILYVRGGPECTYNADFWHEFLALASAGMAVIYANPRGSTGYGREFCAGGIAWRQEAMNDLLAAVDACVAKGFIDPERIGVTGGSYGGYMTNKFIGRMDRFAAAVTQRSLVNPVTSYGTGDMGFVSSNPNAGEVKMMDVLIDRAKGNPLTYIDNIKVPLLILHGYQDYRCSFEQAEQIFIAMKDRNPEVPVRLVMFPKENHGVDRIGKLYNQVRHLKEMTDWFSEYLGADAEPALEDLSTATDDAAGTSAERSVG